MQYCMLLALLILHDFAPPFHLILPHTTPYHPLPPHTIPCHPIPPTSYSPTPPDSTADKDKLQGVANSVMVLVDAMVRKSEQQLSDSGKVLQEVLSAAADEKGEWYIPLAPAQV